MNLVIVESPAKAKTIEKYLGRDHKVVASYGHVRDLPQKELGIDIDKDFKPDYVIPVNSKKTIALIKKELKTAKKLYLATDLDREGEAISWHILEALKIKGDDTRVERITFHEITKSAIERAIKNPRGINIHLVDAQQARRVLDRLVGYKLSPLLWRKVKSGLSAGRVQSVAVRLIVEREEEIKKFKPTEFWVIGVNLSKIKDDKIFCAFLAEIDGKEIKKLDIKTKKEADAIEKDLEKSSYKVLSIDESISTRHPSAPFTTSTMQMEASRKLGFSAKQTMRLAQNLYEDGHITYMRTDSINLSKEAVKTARDVIKSEFGEKYLPDGEQKYVTKTKRAQEAHEAIRPTDLKEKEVTGDARGQRLYDLIWKRTVASQMKDAEIKIIEAKIEADGKKKYIFMSRGENIKFDGFIRVYTEGKDEETEELNNPVPPLEKNEKLDYHDFIKNQKFTEPPKRYSEATLVKKLESLGIGRPSTYAPTLSTIQDRGYVGLENRFFSPTEIGTIVSDLLVANFNDVVDYQFTAKMEDEFDNIATGDREWVPVIREFYEPFAKNLTVKNKELEKKDFIKPKILTEKCPECGKKLMERLGRFGKFIACSGYPECKYSRPLSEVGGKVINEDGKAESVKKAESEKCEKCGGEMIMKEGRFGKFLACSNYPKCKNTKTVIQSTGMKCPDCGDGQVVEKRTKKGRKFWGCSKYPSCKYASWEDPTIKKDNESH